jgi:hypothetical protein
VFVSTANAQALRMQPFWKNGNSGRKMHRMKIAKPLEHDPNTFPVVLGGAQLQPY